MRLIYFQLLLLLMAVSISSTQAQQTAALQEPGSSLRKGQELFEKEKFGSARNVIEDIMASSLPPVHPDKVSAGFYLAWCAAELCNRDAETQLVKQIQENPGNSMCGLSWFYLGKYRFRERSWAAALQAFGKVNLSDLDNARIAEYYYQKGYSFLQQGNEDSAYDLLSELRESRSKYAVTASFYCAYIDYQKKRYPEAMKGFSIVSNDATYGKQASAFIAQIHYIDHQYSKVLETALPLLNEDKNRQSSKKTSELVRMVGDSYYRTGKYAEAIPYLEMNMTASGSKTTPETIYALAYAYYASEKYTEAVPLFQQLTTAEDSLAQLAFFSLADCYLKTGQKNFALNAFQSAYKSGPDKTIREEALFNYARLSYELSMNPNNDVVKTLRTFIRDYPDSKRLDEVNKYLINIFLTTRNYKDALESLQSMKSCNDEMKKAYQQVTYYRGCELFNQGDYENAVILFKKSMEKALDFRYPDLGIYANSRFWTGEALFRQENFWGAIKYYKEFLDSPGAKELPLYNKASYNLGYANFYRKDYPSARISFTDFVNKGKDEDVRFKADAFLRLGDIAFIGKDYNEAIRCYGLAVQLKTGDIDYGLLQQAMSQGALGKYREKINDLKEMLASHPASKYTTEARYELGMAYLTVKDNANALDCFTKIAEQKKIGSFIPKALLKIGLIHYNENNPDKALAEFKKVVADYGGTQAATEALNSIKNICLEQNRIDDYLSYASTIPSARVSETEQDSLLYSSAENYYMSGDCPNAAKGFARYIDKFPTGVFCINANFYKSDCEMKTGNLDEALKNLDFVAKQPVNAFSEQAVLNAAQARYKLKKYQEALHDYKQLEELSGSKKNSLDAIAGQMRCYYLLNDYAASSVAANKVLIEEKLPEKLQSEAHITLARSAYALDDLGTARKEFTITLKLSNHEQAAESKYYLALIASRSDDAKEAEKIIFELIKQYGSYDFWVAKGLILLADVYTKSGNTFQAKQTLRSIIDNYEGADLVDIARQKLDAIIQAEQSVQPKE